MKSMFRQGIQFGGTDTHYTPKWVINRLPEIFGINHYLDPCPGAPRAEEVVNRIICEANRYDGLSYHWNDVAQYSYVNPPYSQMKDWIDKASLEADCGHTSLWLTKIDYRTRWYADLELAAEYIRPLKGYISFETENYLPRASATFQVGFAIFGIKAPELSGLLEAVFKDKLVKRY